MRPALDPEGECLGAHEEEEAGGMLRDGEGGVDGTALWKEVGMGLVDVASCCWAERVGEAASMPARPMDVIFLSFCLGCASGCESLEKKTPY